MKFRFLFPLLFVLSYTAILGKNILQQFDRTVYYAALKSDKIEDIDRELEVLKSTHISEKDAFEGALLMKKAGLAKIPTEKLKLFKTGRIALETELAKDSTITEYRFLRLIIQEHAPKIVRYRKELMADKLYIQKNFKTLPPALQRAIRDYSKVSKVLQPADL